MLIAFFAHREFGENMAWAAEAPLGDEGIERALAIRTSSVVLLRVAWSGMFWNAVSTLLHQDLIHTEARRHLGSQFSVFRPFDKAISPVSLAD
ncbi:MULTISPECIES: hypothetical protein [unclassified Rhizobium]|uniref:hypothetical protein n=1 Tax=unclassified Rhizobium TaxID=2613769 RepID=UPI000712D8D7|nr:MULTISPECIES: hypothetical protein [unclassified Rhizobium]KQS77326.1 hypothetical protein ASG58_10050 [Rhizobium sp. Leaf383]KQY48449.1 hypothetical protein ASD32_10205 [Rhizobium sp. Root483D2]MBP2463611.1 hypothetical protein [Rhizobium sp. PvP014]MBP2531006.1 hypothetical protein [Rhizobium sp. PvP099]